MNILAMFPLHLTLVFVVALINNMALSSPQDKNQMAPILRAVPETSFSCRGRTAGYYADTEAYCQAYHMCDTQERQYSYLCPGFTLFNQKYMVCDHWHAVNCSLATGYYDLNYNIGRVPGDNEVEEDIPVKRKTKDKDANAKTSLVSKLSRSQESFFNTTLKIAAKTSITTTPKPITLPQTASKPVKIPQTTPKPVTLSQTATKPVTLPQTTPRSTTERFKFTPPQIFTSALTTSTKAPPSEDTLAIEKQSLFSPRALLINFGSVKEKHPFFRPRGSDMKVKFGHGKDDSEEEDFNALKFHPIFKKKSTKFFDERNFTISPDILTSTLPTPPVEEFEDLPPLESESPVEYPLTFLVPPFPSSVQSPPRSENARLFPISTILVPPPKAPVILQGDNQEIRTPLVISRRIQPPLPGQIDLPPPQSHITPPRFPFSRRNRDFYIPSPGLTAPLPGNSIADDMSHGRNEEERHIFHHMTMRFPTRVSTRKRPFRLNPECPQCHPAFLRPNQCQPCVIIK